MKKFGLAAMAGLAAAAAAAGAQEARRPQAFDALIACRTVADPAARLACFDRESAALDAAAKADQVVVLDRQQVRETRRSLFGFQLPAIKLFQRAPGEKQEDLSQIDATIASIGRGPDGVVFTIEGGARWVQTDGAMVSLAGTRPGSKVTIRKGALGSYFARFASGAGFRAKRAD